MPKCLLSCWQFMSMFLTLRSHNSNDTKGNANCGNSRHSTNTAVGLEDFCLFWAVKVVSSGAWNITFLRLCLQKTQNLLFYPYFIYITKEKQKKRKKTKTKTNKPTNILKGDSISGGKYRSFKWCWKQKWKQKLSGRNMLCICTV